MTRPFILLATQRTGSSVLWRTLDAHPRLHVRGEMFMKGMDQAEAHATWLGARPARRLVARVAPAWTLRRYLDGFFVEKEGIDACGFKLMYSQAQPEVWRWIEQHRADVIHLVRRNPLKILVSKAAAELTGRRHLEPDESHRPQPVHLDVENLVTSLDRIQDQVQEHRDRIANWNHLEVHYEDLLAEPQALFDRCFGFLGVPGQSVELALQKLTPNGLREALSNYPEVAETLEKTAHAALLDDA